MSELTALDIIEKLEDKNTYAEQVASGKAAHSFLLDSFYNISILNYDDTILDRVMCFNEVLKPDGVPYISRKYLAYSIVRSCLHELYNTYKLGEKTQADIKNDTIYKQINEKVSSFISKGLTSLDDMDKVDAYFTDYHVAYTLITEEKLPTGISYSNMSFRTGTSQNGNLFKLLSPHNLFLANKAIKQSLLLPSDMHIPVQVMYSTCADLFEHYSTYTNEQKAALLINVYQSFHGMHGAIDAGKMLSGLVHPNNRDAQEDIKKITRLGELGFDNLSREQLEQVLMPAIESSHVISGNLTLSI